MSTHREKLEAIYHAVQVAKKEVNKLETIKSVSKLHQTQEYQLDMAKDVVKRGKSILKYNNYTPEREIK